MGKKRSAAGGVKANGASLAEQIDRREQAELLRSARDKGFRGLSAKEKRAVEQQQNEQCLGTLESCTRGFFTEDLLGTSSKVLNDNQRRRNFPWPAGKGRVDGLSIFRWLFHWYLEHPLPTAGSGRISEEDVLLVGASPELKDELLRERIRERRLVNRQKAMELLHIEQSHIPTERVEQFAGGLAEVARKRSEDEQRRFEKDFGPAAAQRVAQMFEDFANAALKRFENEFGDGIECDDSDAAA